MDNYYEFKYVHHNQEVVHRMGSDVVADEMYYFIREFLLGCSWYPETVDKIIGKEED